jgi:excisionase family DNA binding protein
VNSPAPGPRLAQALAQVVACMRWKAVDSCGLESTGVQLCAFAFVEDLHVSSNTCMDVQACANTGSVSDEKSKNVQAHASLSKDFAGSLLDGMALDGELQRSVPTLVSVRQAAKVLGVCRATIYRLCERGELPYFRILNAIRVDIQEVKAILRQSGRRGQRQEFPCPVEGKRPS